jgi:hypothetical protein
MTTREDAVHERTHQIGSLIAHSWLVVKNSLLLRLLLGLLFLGWFRLLLPVSWGCGGCCCGAKPRLGSSQVGPSREYGLWLGSTGAGNRECRRTSELTEAKIELPLPNPDSEWSGTALGVSYPCARILVLLVSQSHFRIIFRLIY